MLGARARRRRTRDDGPATGRAGRGRRRARSGRPPAPTASCATRSGTRSVTLAGRLRRHHRQAWTCRATCRSGRLFTVGPATTAATACSPQRDPRPAGTPIVARCRCARPTSTLHRLLLVEALVIGVVLLRARARRLARRPDRPAAARPDGPPAGPDRRRRPLPPRRGHRPAHRGRPPRDRAQPRCSTASRRRSPTPGHRGAPAPFIADASHELRTPLASIRGYAELFRMGAVPDGPEAERAMRRIEDEAARMGVLVEDLLTLARLDQLADAPHAELDVAALAARRGRRRARDRARPRDLPGRRPVVPRARRRPPAAPGARQPAAQRARAHAARGRRSRCPSARPAPSCALDRARPRPRLARPTTPTPSSSASGARRAAASAAPAAPDSGWRSSPAIVDAHGGRCAAPTPTAAAPRSSSSCPLSGNL